MKFHPTVLLVPLALSGCEIENKLTSLYEAEGMGQCDLELPQIFPGDVQPIAVCESNRRQLAPLRESANFIGENSFDPNGYDIIDYQWNLVKKPSGSSLEFSERDVNAYGFTPDLAGEYTFELVVANEKCVVSDPCEVSLSAVPLEDLWIELSWENAGDDMDLHLIRNGAGFESDGDCYYGNCVGGYGLDWGRTGFQDDDPRLDLDDVDGTGPENINITEPAEGSYTVVIHDYPGSEFYDTNRASVRVHLGGEIAFEGEISISGEDSRTPIAEIEWPSMQVESLID